MKKVFLFPLLAFFMSQGMTAQVKLGDNPQSIDPASLFELESTDQVLVITRVSNAELQAINPSMGALAYNTDEKCLFYHNGDAWINLCEALGRAFTTDPIQNEFPTIVITPLAESINFEVGEIRSENIVDFSIGSQDIQNNSINSEKLADASVGAAELQDNTVTGRTMDFVDITLSDFVNDVPFLVQGDLVAAAIFYDNTTSGLGGSDIQAAIDVLSSGLSAIDLQAIGDGTYVFTGSDGTTTDFDLNATALPFDNASNGFTASTVQGAIEEIQGSSSDDQEILNFAFNETSDELTLTLEDGGTRIADLGALNQSASEVPVAGNPSNYTPEAADVEGHLSGIDAALVVASGGNPNDELNLTFEVNGTNLELTDNGGTLQVPLAELGSDNQTATQVNVAASPVNYNPISADVEGHLAGIDEALISTGSGEIPDNELITDIQLAGTDLIVTEAGIDFTVSLAGLSGGTPEAQNVSFNPTPNTVSDNVQDAIEELQNEIDGIVTTGTNPNDELIDSFVLTGTSLEIREAGTLLTPIDLDPTFVTETELAALSFDDADADPGNELQDITSLDASVIVTPNGNDFDISVPGSTDSQNLAGAIAGTELTISIDNGSPAVVDLDPIFVTETELAALSFDDADADPGNELQNITSLDASVIVTPNGNDFDLSVPGSTDSQNLSGTIAGTELTISIENGSPAVVDLDPAFVTETELAALSFDDADADPGNELQNITSLDASVIVTPNGNDFDLSVPGSTDSQNLAGAIAGTELTISIDNGSPAVVELDPTFVTETELAALSFDDADADPGNELQNITSLDASVIVTPNGNDFDLSVPGSTDNQNLAGAIAGTELTISIDNGSPAVVELDPTFVTETELAALSFDDADADPGNELQDITSLDGSVSITPNGNDFDLSVSAIPVGTSGALFYSNGSGGLVDNPTQIFWDQANNRLGIGTNTPQNKLQVNGEVRSQGYSNSNGTATEPSYAFSNDTDTGMWRGANTNFLRFSTDGIEAMTIDPVQNIGIGITTPTERLHVNGNILATGTITPDYVFEKYFKGTSELNPNYEFQNLREVYAFIQKNNHLPGVPSAEAVAQQGGVLVNRATEINLEKIEELFLHAIEQEQQIQTLQKEKEILNREVSELKQRLDRIEQAMAQRPKN